MEKKLLIVDDEVHIRMLIEQTLEELEDEGVNFLTAENGEQALEIIQAEHPQLVFLDVMISNICFVSITSCLNPKGFQVPTSVRSPFS